METDITHNCCSYAVVFKSAFSLELLCTDCDGLIAVQNSAKLVNYDKSVSVAVESNADVKSVFFNVFSKGIKMERAAVAVYVSSVRFTA